MAIIEYFYSAHSAYAYLGSARLQAIADKGGHVIRHRVIDLRKVLAQTASCPIGTRSEASLEYFFGREIRRWAEERQVPVMEGTPTQHGRDMTLPSCVLIAAELHGHRIDHLAHSILEAHWRDDADIADENTLRRLLERAGLNADHLFEQAGEEKTLSIYEANTEEAIHRSVFGSPTYFVDGDMFYGQDRLDMVEKALVRPYAP